MVVNLRMTLSEMKGRCMKSKNLFHELDSGMKLIRVAMHWGLRVFSYAWCVTSLFWNVEAPRGVFTRGGLGGLTLGWAVVGWGGLWKGGVGC